MSGQRQSGAGAAETAGGEGAADAAVRPEQVEPGEGGCRGPSLPEIALALEQAARALRREARLHRVYAAHPEQAEPVEAVLRRTGAAAPPDPSGDLVLTAAQVRTIVAARRLRADYLPDVSGDHAFSMLLELYAARLEGRRIPQTRLGTIAGVPHATAIRIVHALVQQGLAAAASDPADRRLNLLALTDEAAERMGAYLRLAASAGLPLV